jgi:hypothetical protein
VDVEEDFSPPDLVDEEDDSDFESVLVSDLDSDFDSEGFESFFPFAASFPFRA